MHRAQVRSGSRALVAIASAGVLVACGMSGGKSASGNQAPQAHPETRPAHQAGDAVDPDLVAAVSSAHTNTPIALKFGLAARPVVGTPLKVRVAVITAAGVDISHIHESFQPGDGLQLQSDRSFDVDDPSAGAVLQQELSVLPQQAGVLSLNATIMVDMDGGSLARSYTIPLIVHDSP